MASKILQNVLQLAKADCFDMGTHQLCIHFRDGLGGFFRGGQLHKAHSPADACVAVPQNLAGHDGAKLLHTCNTRSNT